MGHPIESLTAVTASMREALAAGKTGPDVAKAVHKTLTTKASKNANGKK